MHIWGNKRLYHSKYFKLGSSNFFFHISCPQFTIVNDERRHFLLLAITSYLKSVSGLNFIQGFFLFCFVFVFVLFFMFCFVVVVVVVFVCLFVCFCCFVFCVLHNNYDINHVNIIFFVFVGLQEKVFAIPQLSPKYIP